MLSSFIKGLILGVGCLLMGVMFFWFLALLFAGPAP